MKKMIIALFVLWLASLACSLEPTAGAASEPFPTERIPSPAPSVTTVSTETPITPGTCTVMADVLHLRDAPSIEGTVTAWLFAGDVASIESTRGAWYQVTTDRGAGYVHSKYCMKGKEDD